MTKTLNRTMYAERDHLKIVKHVQYTSEYRTGPVFEWCLSDTICVRFPNHSKSGPDFFSGQTRPFWHKKYFIHDSFLYKTVQASGPFENRTQKSGFRMVAAILFLPFENRTGRFFIASLDHFVMNKIFFMTLFFIKRSMLVTGHFCPVFKWSGYQMVDTGIRLNPI